MEKHDPKQKALKAELTRLFFISVGVFLFILLQSKKPPSLTVVMYVLALLFKIS